MTARILSEDEIRHVYINHLKKDFPCNEVISYKNLTDLHKAGRYVCYGFYEEGRFVSYAFIIKDDESGTVLLDYIAVVREMRGSGYGSKALKELEKICGEYRYVIIEVDNPAFAKSDEEKTKRVRRIKFYQNLGVTFSGAETKVCGADFQLMTLNTKIKPDKADVERAIDCFYKIRFNRFMYRFLFRIK